MAIAEALELIERDWPDIEMLVPVRVLATIAGFRRLEADRADELPEAILRVLLPALPADHDVWATLDDSGTRFQESNLRTEAVLASRCVEHAVIAMADPAIVAHAVADHLEDMAQEAIRRHDVVSRAELPHDLPVGPFEVDDGLVARFVFASTTPPRLHDVVVVLNERLRGDLDPAGALSWWLTPNAWLGASPAELLGRGRDAEIAYAADQLANDSW